MDRKAFWKLIDDAGHSVDDVYEVAAAVAARLTAEPESEIVSFKQHQYDLLDESYRWDLWAVAYIVNGGCSDDGFDYFRAWLMANGFKRWQAAMKAPESIGDWAEDEGGYEEMLYAADNAYQTKTGDNLPVDRLTITRSPEPTGEPWQEEELPGLYPQLCEKYFDQPTSRSVIPNTKSNQESFGSTPDSLAELANVQIDFPRMASDSPTKCPSWPDDVISYVVDEWPELDPLDESRLQFLRTAIVEDRDYWIWQFTTPDGESAFLIVYRVRDTGQTCTSGDINQHNLTPEQLILGCYRDLI